MSLVFKRLVRLLKRVIGPSLSPVPTENKTNTEQSYKIHPPVKFDITIEISEREIIRTTVPLAARLIWWAQINKYLLCSCLFIYFTRPPCSFILFHNTKMNLTRLGREGVTSMKLAQDTFRVHGNESSGSIKTVHFVDQMMNYIYFYTTIASCVVT
jgi:hypothetical protein